jgi:hypothetical protein
LNSTALCSRAGAFCGDFPNAYDNMLGSGAGITLAFHSDSMIIQALHTVNA